ncbi:MAG: FecR family protein [Gammaproteobacteria bacterium]
MSETHPPSPAGPPPDVRRQAIQWLVCRHSGAWSQADEAAFEAWLRASPANRREYDAIRHLWASLEAFKAGAAAEREAARRYRGPRPWYRSPWVPRLALGLASVLGMVAIGLRYSAVMVETYTTAKGEQSTVDLRDGSRIVLNTDTALTVHLTPDERRVDLARGQALFTVVHDAERPFQVVAGAGRIRDLGTRFDVYREADRVAVSVLEGRIDVTTGRSPEARPLAAGQETSYDAGGRMSVIRATDVRVIAAWQTGKLVFRDVPLSAALAQVARYHPVEFELAGPGLDDIRISGTFKSADLQILLVTLEAAFPLEAEVLDPGHIRFRRRPR